VIETSILGFVMAERLGVSPFAFLGCRRCDALVEFEVGGRFWWRVLGARAFVVRHGEPPSGSPLLKGRGERALSFSGLCGGC
jgi:hypothetical protein